MLFESSANAKLEIDPGQAAYVPQPEIRLQIIPDQDTRYQNREKINLKHTSERKNISQYTVPYRFMKY